MEWAHSWRLVLLLALSLAVVTQFGGCYYVQAVSGQLELIRKREPIVEVVQDPELPDDTRRRLNMVLEARQFAVDELKLPENDSYRTYADLKRDFVVWNVLAAPEFSVQGKTWCFPVVGCVAYRGYFSETAARRFAAKLADDGYDVHVGGVAAYSTLGRFDDPLLNTMLRWSDLDLVSTLFHELAHQRLFIKGDTAFNESFATAVAEAGLERWLEARGGKADLAGHLARDELREALTKMVGETRTELSALYALTIDDGTKRQKKTELLERLSADAAEVAKTAGFAAPGWVRPPLNNARLLSVALYRGHLDAFRHIFSRCSDDFACFYTEAKRLSELEPEVRQNSLAELSVN